MKVAVCFFGITRNLAKHTLASIEEQLLVPVARLDPEYKKFGHFNISRQISNPRTGEKNVAVDPDEYTLLHCDAVAHTNQEWLDSQLNLEELKKFGDSWEDEFSSLKNLLRQLYSLNQVTELLLQAGRHFDLVIYSRADIRFHGQVKFPTIRPATLYTPWFDKFRGLNDRFALGDFETMVKYGRRHLMVRQFCEETGKPLHAERFLLWYSQKQRLLNKDLTQIEFCRVRANGKAESPDTTIRAKLNYRIKKALQPLRRTRW